MHRRITSSKYPPRRGGAHGLAAALLVSLAVVACAGPSNEEIMEAVLMTAHATGAVNTRSLSASAAPFENAVFDHDQGLARFTGMDLTVFQLDSPYTRLEGTVRIGPTEISRAQVRLEGGPITELTFGYDEVDLLGSEWTVRGTADGRDFTVEFGMDEVRAFRARE